MKTIISDGQCLIDLAIQETGGLEGLFALAELNGIEIGGTLTAGQETQITPEIISNPAQVKYFADRGLRINASNSNSLADLPDPTPSGSIWVDENGNYISDGNGNYILTNL